MTPAVLIFVATGCGACHNYVPRIEKLVEPYRRAGMEVYIRDIAKNERALAQAEKFGVRATPTTFFRTRSGAVTRRVGALHDAQIQEMLARTAR